MTGLETSPKSPQHPYPPIFIGGGGERVLSLAGREADIVGVHRRSNAGSPIDARERTEAALEQKVAWVRQAAGERFASLELNMQLIRVMITENRQQAAEKALREFSGQAWVAGITPEGLLADPYWLIGSVDQAVDHVCHLREAYGISYFMVDSEDIEIFAPVVARLAGA